MEFAYACLALPAGMLLGLFYFGLLWITVRSLASARAPALHLAVSFVIRGSVCMLGFYLIMQGHWERLLIALLGFVLMRKILVRRLAQRKAEER
ncbi:MAG: ATP synthase subunit I [Candidatus Abyssobacteria bacterium SURF_5]|uniref:ATP synthase subunit I n=1 Tax=Abyssobacteria bacterium (strain SURF_5) TaxID=2093360 RepID=A0A3A4N246_ABYX5|nr:MAG: ATP synthase subunit I [Candidatus Abyssubacteria bacterium SURF_5]